MDNGVVMVAIYVTLYILGLFMHSFSKRDIIFGVSIKEEYLDDEKLLAYKSQYIKSYGLIVGALAIVFMYLDINYYRVYNSLIFCALWIGIIVYLFACFNKKVKLFKKETYRNDSEQKPIRVSASLTNREVETPMVHIYFITPVIIIMITAIITALNYESIPQQLPMQYDFNGVVISYASKGFVNVFLMVFTQIFMTALIYLMTYSSIRYSKRKLDPRKPRTSEAQYRVAMNRFAIVMSITLVILNVIFLFAQLTIIGLIELNGKALGLVTIIPTILIVAIIIRFFITTGMNGERVKVDVEEEALDVEGPDDEDDYWVYGMFYYNKKDPSIFVPKRMGGGFTINFGNPTGVIITVIIFVIIILFSIVPLFQF